MPDPPRRRLDAALLEESVDDLYEHAPCGYLSTLPDGTIVRVNQTFLDWTGHARERLLGGTRFQALLTMGSRIYFETHYAPLLRMQGEANEIAFEIVCADGRVLPVVANSRQRRDGAGVPLFNRITVFDSTTRRRYERELLLAKRKAQQVAADKAELLGVLSHDIRNPLNALMGVVRLLDATHLDDRQLPLVRLLRSSSENLLGLLDKVLAWSQAESDAFALSETPLSLTDVIQSVVSEYEASAWEKGVAIRFASDDRVPRTVLGDPVAIREIVTNLVGNAVKFTERGHVEAVVRTKEVATDAVTVAVTVADTGIGIAPERLDRIFDKYRQGSADTQRRFGGVGLGLAITRRLLALYGSKVHLESVVGEGTTASFDLRLALPPDEGKGGD